MTNRTAFCIALAQRTGLDPNVVQAWAVEEEGWDAENASDLGNQNWLNIGYFDSGPGQIAYNTMFETPDGGAEATANFLSGEWGDASERIRSILAEARGKDAAGQIAAIGNSGWATNPDYASQIQGVYNDIFAKGLQITMPDPTPTPKPKPKTVWMTAEVAIEVGQDPTGIVRFSGTCDLSKGNVWGIGGEKGENVDLKGGSGQWRIKGLPLNDPPIG